VTQQLLARHGVVTREALNVESIPGGFGVVYPVLKGLEEAGRLRRGYFVAGLGATQFALPGALDLLRSLRTAPDEIEVAVLAATDPANPYGAALKWTRQSNERLIPTTRTDAHGWRDCNPRQRCRRCLFEPRRSAADHVAAGGRARTNEGRARGLAGFDRSRALRGRRASGMLIEEIDALPAGDHPLAQFLIEAGFVKSALGIVPGRRLPPSTRAPLETAEVRLKATPRHAAPLARLQSLRAPVLR
jgi:ATP-dependent Lhr-like helicase